MIKTVLDFLNLGLSALIRKFVHYDSMRVWLFAVMLLLFLTYFFFLIDNSLIFCEANMNYCTEFNEF